MDIIFLDLFETHITHGDHSYHNVFRVLFNNYKSNNPLTKISFDETRYFIKLLTDFDKIEYSSIVLPFLPCLPRNVLPSSQELPSQELLIPQEQLVPPQQTVVDSIDSIDSIDARKSFSKDHVLTLQNALSTFTTSPPDFKHISDISKNPNSPFHSLAPFTKDQLKQKAMLTHIHRLNDGLPPGSFGKVTIQPSRLKDLKVPLPSS